MLREKSYLICLLLIFLSAACQREVTEDEIIHNYSQNIIPSAAQGIVLMESGEQEIAQSSTDSFERSLLQIDLPEEYIPLRFIDVNLDLDQMEERIIAYKLRGDVNSDIIRILIANFNSQDESYSVSWTGETLANNIRTLSITIEDIIGDHVEEIICFGVKNTGEQTLDIFRRVAGTDNQGIVYNSILSQISNAGLEIERNERSALYKNQQEAGQSFPVVRYHQDSDQEDIETILKETYYWNRIIGRYVLGPVVAIPNDLREKQLFRELYSGDALDVAQHLNGLWQNVSDKDLDDRRLFYFDATSKNMAIFYEKTQEWFVVRSMYKTALGTNPGLWISIYNMLLTSFQRQLRITLQSADRIRINMEDMDYWNGEYVYLDLQEQLEEIQKPMLELNGLYTNQNGQELYFSSNNFTMHDGNKKLSGFFHIFYVDRPILDLRILHRSGLEQENKRYLIEYAVENEDGKLTQRLRLYPVQLAIDSVKLIPGDILYFEQISSENQS